MGIASEGSLEARGDFFKNVFQRRSQNGGGAGEGRGRCAMLGVRPFAAGWAAAGPCVCADFFRIFVSLAHEDIIPESGLPVNEL